MQTRGDVLDRDALGINASIDFDTIRSSGPPSRPLEFPAPTLGRAVTVAADIIDHRTGNIFLATSVLMRRPVHSKNYPSHGQAVRPRRRASLDLGNVRGHNGRIPKSCGRRTYSHRANARGGSTLTSCDPSCDLPDRAYCIRKKLGVCNTAHGSVRLCVVLERGSSMESGVDVDVGGCGFGGRINSGIKRHFGKAYRCQ